MCTFGNSHKCICRNSRIWVYRKATPKMLCMRPVLMTFCFFFMYVCVYTNSNSNVCVHMQIYINVCVCIQKFVYMWMYKNTTPIFLRVDHTLLFVCVCMCVCVCVCVCTNSYGCRNIHMYVGAHMQLYTIVYVMRAC